MLRHFKEHKTAITSLAVGSSDDHVFSSSRDRSILCWDLARRRPRADAHARACPSGLPMLECAERPPQVQGARTTALSRDMLRPRSTCLRLARDARL